MGKWQAPEAQIFYHKDTKLECEIWMPRLTPYSSKPLIKDFVRIFSTALTVFRFFKISDLIAGKSAAKASRFVILF
jgi:hypothetical protein